MIYWNKLSKLTSNMSLLIIFSNASNTNFFFKLNVLFVYADKNSFLFHNIFV